jgi:inner membrane protease subunit 1
MVQVPEGHVWLAGDNLPYTRDSRTYGPLPMALIKGKIIATSHGWFEFRTWRWFSNHSQLAPVEDLGQQQA